MKRIKREVIYLLTFLVVAGCLFGGILIVLKTGNSVNVAWTDKDFQSACKKTYLVFDGNMKPALNISKENGNLGATLSSAELTALASEATQKYNAINGLSIKLDSDNIIEVSFKLGNNLDTLFKLIPDLNAYKNYLDLAKGSPIYMKASISYAGNNQLAANVLSLSFGQIKIDNDKANAMASSVLSQLTTDLNSDNIDITALTINDDMFYYKAEIQK